MINRLIQADTNRWKVKGSWLKWPTIFPTQKSYILNAYETEFVKNNKKKKINVASKFWTGLCLLSPFFQFWSFMAGISEGITLYYVIIPPLFFLAHIPHAIFCSCIHFYKRSAVYMVNFKWQLNSPPMTDHRLFINRYSTNGQDGIYKSDVYCILTANVLIESGIWNLAWMYSIRSVQLSNRNFWHLRRFFTGVYKLFW